MDFDTIRKETIEALELNGEDSAYLTDEYIRESIEQAETKKSTDRVETVIYGHSVFFHAQRANFRSSSGPYSNQCGSTPRSIVQNEWTWTNTGNRCDNSGQPIYRFRSRA